MRKFCIPKTIQVGFQKRNDTYTGKLGYVTYMDDKGVLRQEKSWSGWRDHSIKVLKIENTPQANFIFNKDVKRYGYWNSSSEKIRIYDSRDFEFEIDTSNMMYILMHSDVSKRDIQEKCVFAWEGKNLVLLPVTSEYYKEAMENTRKQGMKFSTKDLVLGHTYSTKNENDFIYMGYFDWSQLSWNGSSRSWKGVGKKHIGYFSKKQYQDSRFQAVNPSDICECISDEVSAQYAALVDKLHKVPNFKKTGTFSVKKGFDIVGYKKTQYETYKLTLKSIINTKGKPSCSYKIEKINLSIKEDKAVISTEKNNSYYSGNPYESELHSYDCKVDKQNIEQMKDYFLSKGFGTLYFTDTQGKKVLVE